MPVYTFRVPPMEPPSTVTVKDSGGAVVSTGTASDTGSYSVDLPVGAYVLTDSNGSTTGPSAVYSSAPPGTLGGAVAKDELVLNVKDYGALGNGSADDTSAIQAAIDAATAAGGGTVIIPKNGIFLFTSIKVKSNVTLAGYGGTLKLKDGVCVNAGTSYYLLHNLVGDGTWYSNVTYRDLIINGNSANNTLHAVADAITAGGENVKVLNNWIKDTPDSGVMFSAAKNGLCCDNRIEDGADLGIYINDGDGTRLYECVISGNRISGFPLGGGIAVKRAGSRLVIAENTIYNCANGVTLEQGAVGTDYSTNVTIVNNRMRHIGYAGGTGLGINIRGSTHTIVTGNRIEDANTRAIYIQGCTHSVVSNNTISCETTSDPTYGIGIDVAERDATATSYTVISDNVISNAKYVGIRLGGTLAHSFNHVSGNVVTGAGSVGMVVASLWTNNIITGNILSGTSYDISYIPAITSNVWADNRLINGTISGGILAPNLTATPEAFRSAGGVFSNYGDATYATRLGNTGMGAAAVQLLDISLYRGGASTLSVQAGKNFAIQDGLWNGGKLVMGAYHIWVDASGRLKIKSGAPANDADGTIIGTQA